jgi:hypothetical protein
VPSGALDWLLNNLLNLGEISEIAKNHIMTDTEDSYTEDSFGDDFDEFEDIGVGDEPSNQFRPNDLPSTQSTEQGTPSKRTDTNMKPET